ncbi:MAG: protein-export membrane protein SecD [Deltaproteobacteria bacterium CG2_30_63_29]|nr:MAG: protein-export membrane protein SecD [Deltaproteobacteria bacterium CG2_30_63_29]PIW02565.1 MAG: protein translocase subunit SecD [Deltaproteobacteria bacterium CG17_big_fil_post_rev_8_21_14_2_50_63_7]
MPRSWWIKSGFVLFLVVLSILGLVPTYIELVAYPEKPQQPTTEQTDEEGQDAQNGTATPEDGAEGAPQEQVRLTEDERDPALPEWYVWYQNKVTDNSLTLGLDLQGGLLLRYSVDVDQAIDDKLEKYGQDLQFRLDELGVTDVKAKAMKTEDRVELTFGDTDDMDKVDDEFMRDFPVLSLVSDDGPTMLFGLRENYIQETEEFSVKQAVEIIRERVDAIGVASPSVRIEGGRHIVVELPGLSSRRATAAEKLIATTAVLSFKLVADAPEAATVFKAYQPLLTAESGVKFEGGTLVATDTLTKDGKIKNQGKDLLKVFIEANEFLGGEDREIAYERVDQDKGKKGKAKVVGPQQWRTRLVRTDMPILTGENVDDAYPATNQSTNLPYVALKLDKKGGDLFYDVTKEHVGDQLAILMDDTLVSDPVIRSEIPGGNVSIEMGGSNRQQILDDVQNLVVALRSGALPAPIRQEFKTLVGPTLGRDSISKATMALIIGSIVVFAFMFLYYKLGGAVANLALLLNVLFIMAIMAALGAALTLPGIAGIVLTVGMAVDANVIIFERIREEIRAGETLRKAIQYGYDKAFWTIVDSNITTGIAALVLMEFGSGPVRGFAITLLIGIICSVFTAVFVTRLIFDAYLTKTKAERLPL